MFKFPKDDKNFHWTSHIKDKMLFYRIPESKIKTTLKKPDRLQEGVAPNTMAAMKRNDTPKSKNEIWLMYTERGSKRIMISAWRYPGKSKPDKKIPIPEEILAEIKKEWF
ncbi:MAG: hypothetical protein HYT03_00380 [Candidatus Harrisonbacteria bacterium]|nr:hypothetical protein [Candidatus Harrisonbacteria bacterium]